MRDPAVRGCGNPDNEKITKHDKGVLVRVDFPCSLVVAKMNSNGKENTESALLY